ncbi:hypothetical protein FC15_GL000155 [Lapidilactobacillus concavus DSM 17758]|uniref:Uncharacterized protein n=1 Tax=Lapidilactobacillus concavus DSM 17758 TaxID=1423735 RepID=A0A0R1W4K5_9LACO|nr:hypothetical protein [Lapidilactobacillus concavus]KRM12702.1 hypothetical protein FC15_GL000155 [Lapidilactobacillus concavus DSM 17758]
MKWRTPLLRVSLLRNLSNRTVDTAADSFSRIFPDTFGVPLLVQGNISLGVLFMISNPASQFISPVINFFCDFTKK